MDKDSINKAPGEYRGITPEEFIKRLTETCNELERRQEKGRKDLDKMVRSCVEFFSEVPGSIIDRTANGFTQEEKATLVGLVNRLCLQEYPVVSGEQSRLLDRVSAYVKSRGKASNVKNSLYGRCIQPLVDQLI